MSVRRCGMIGQGKSGMGGVLITGVWRIRTMIEHKITVNLRMLEHDYFHRHDEHRVQRKQRIKQSIALIRRLQVNPTEADMYDDPTQ